MLATLVSFSRPKHHRKIPTEIVLFISRFDRITLILLFLSLYRQIEPINVNMDMQKKNNLICQYCEMELSSTSAKNRHVRTKHSDQDLGSTSQLPKRNKHIICPICNEATFSYHKDLIEHFTGVHNIAIKESTLYFRNFNEFTVWRAMENREVDYACLTGRKYPDGEEKKIYDCNRSNSKGYVSSAKKRGLKAGGSIRIQGKCPSRIVVKISANGSVTANFVETHVGHIDELRTKRLSKAEQSAIVGQLKAGVSIDRVIEDSKIIKNDKLGRINLLTRADLAYIIRKFKIDRRKDAESNGLFIDEPSTSQDEVFIQETKPDVKPITFEDEREIVIQEMNSFARGLDEQSFNEYAENFRKFKTDWERQNSEETFKEIKIEEPTFM
ncbi:unnamed protein product [Brassicogethes aeneus]|uniref:C2H2-type domain-containing protein n=1 Tax=Brassicogethes aeneus TaxID=1431903 RepID=A0A9P0B386_BRAAE|nr:unnamed protein product [Brassicogethes aeneus]